ncbi:hypothetical protein E2C01_019665 [Portunus trituberculatus]|uniref:Uncharacterized protein n=1 Tax=Portunus trituberculatus TaxID=210409 RepID=A0A5B7DXV3_PORTR|nr:hypothetical protein [Portunus trituberculatus]
MRRVTCGVRGVTRGEARDQLGAWDGQPRTGEDCDILVVRLPYEAQSRWASVQIRPQERIIG